MKISKFVSTIILTTVFSSIYLFGFIFWLYVNANDKTLELLKESLSTTSSFFGGITTLVAAYIAANLFNDWKIQHNKTVEKEIAWDVIQKFDIADTHLAQFRDSFYLFKFKFIALYEMPDDEVKNLNSDLQKILLELKGVILKFASYLESLRKYSIVAENTYYDDRKNQILEICLKIITLQNLKITLPTSIDDIENKLDEIVALVVEIEKSNLNTILTELKTPT